MHLYNVAVLICAKFLSINNFRILKMIATSGFLTVLECTKLVFGLGSAPDPAGRVYSAPQTL